MDGCLDLRTCLASLTTPTHLPPNIYQQFDQKCMWEDVSGGRALEEGSLRHGTSIVGCAPPGGGEGPPAGR